MSRAGYVLVGGRSSRMGSDKALLRHRGGMLVQTVAAAVKQGAAGATLVGDPAIYGSLGFPVIPDLFPGEGPLGGIITALKHSTSDWNFIAACDMPGISPDFIAALLDAAELSGRNILAAAGPTGLPEPLCTAYHLRSLPALQAAFERGIRAAKAVLDEAQAGVIRFQEVSYFQNVNTPDEWAAYAAERS